MICEYEKKQFGEYAEEVIADPSQVVSVSVHGVVEFTEGAGSRVRCERDDRNPEYFSVYARLRDGSSACIGDFEDAIGANLYASTKSREYGVSAYFYQASIAA